MSISEAAEYYRKALKQGQKTRGKAVSAGRYPYLPVLEEIVPDLLAGTAVGQLDIPLSLVIGTELAGRRMAFASDFMPLMPAGSEFANKWIRLCDSHLEEGIRDPILVTEYLGCFYVREGNKRVSVLKALGAPTVSAQVTRILPPGSDTAEYTLYSEFLRYFELSKLYEPRFTKPGSYTALQRVLGFAPDHSWTEEERRQFCGALSLFRDASADIREIPAEELFLAWLKVYSLSEIRSFGARELKKSIEGIRADLKAREKPIALEIHDPEHDPDAKKAAGIGVLTSITRPKSLRAAFVYEYPPAHSDWVRGHETGRLRMEEHMGGRVQTAAYYPEPGTENTGIEALTERAAAEGADILFAVTPPQMAACRRIAAQYPNIRILNCSLCAPYAGVRTYYSRIYEAKFLSGAMAGLLSRGEPLGYVASYPIYGVPAGINAFALGARMTDPDARILLRWSCCERDTMEQFAAAGIRTVSNRDLPVPEEPAGFWGLGRTDAAGKRMPVLSPYWNWGVFYEKIVKSVLDGTWETAPSGQAVNYWWGMESGVIGLKREQGLPDGAARLLTVLEQALTGGTLDPFAGPVSDRDGQLRIRAGETLSKEKLLRMDWLCDNVEGHIPAEEELLPESRTLTSLIGVGRAAEENRK